MNESKSTRENETYEILWDVKIQMIYPISRCRLCGEEEETVNHIMQQISTERI